MNQRNHSVSVSRIDLLTAFRGGEIEIFFEPVVSLASGLPVGFEAFACWNHPIVGFTPLADLRVDCELEDIFIAIGEWVVRNAARQVKKWQDEFQLQSDLSLTVRLSPEEFADEALVGSVAGVLAATRLAGKCLILEVPEFDILQEPATSDRRLKTLKRLGVQISMGDFAASYSSMASLTRFPLDAVRFDHSLVQGTEEARRVASAVMHLARTVGIRTVASGVATQGQVEMLQAVRCRYAQGSHIAPLMTAVDATAWLADRSLTHYHPTYLHPSLETTGSMYVS